MANVFNSVEGLHPKRRAFSADTYRNDFTAPLGVNIPCYVQHVMPATRIKCNASALVRLQALIAPVMDNIDYYVHFWKIPYRLLENDRFTAFISGEKLAEDYDALFETAYDVAYEVVTYIEDYYTALPNNKKIDLYDCIFGNGSLMDFLGYDLSIFPTYSYIDNSFSLSGGNAETKLNWRGFLAYFMLHLNWYMNENVPYFSNFVNLVDSFVKDQDLGSFAALLVETTYMSSYSNLGQRYFVTSFLPHAWEKDYFTSALPNVQNGDPVTLPLGGSAPVTISPIENLTFTNVKVHSDVGYEFTGDNDIAHGGLQSQTSGALMAYQRTTDSIGDGDLHRAYLTADTPEITTASADLSEASAISINELRFANALQIFKERQLRYGRRRLEYYKGFFDVSPEDLRLQVPKYLGGGRIPINIADIEQTSATSGASALGHLAGKATAVAGGFAGFSTFCSEESIIIGIAFSMPHITYANGMSRFILKTNDIYDYYNPSFQHLGEQAIKKIELYAGTDDPDGDFGYTPRYTEYRFHSNEMHGAFKDSLSYWSLGRIFSSTPALNAKFIYMQPHVFDRIFAVSGQPNMVVSMLFHVKSIKPISKYGTPMLLA